MTQSRGPFGSAAPYGSAPTRHAAVRPKTVEAAFWLYILTAVLGAVGIIISVTTYPALRLQVNDQARRQLEAQGQSGALPDGAITAIFDATFAIGIVFGAVFLAAYVVFAFFFRGGANWARIVLTVCAALAIFGTLFTLASLAIPSGARAPQVPGGYATSVGQFLCLVVATVLIYLRPSNDYFRAVKASKLAHGGA